jgi:hypothetical protein
VRLFVGDENAQFSTRLVTVQPGQHTIEIPFEVTGNTRWSTGSDRLVIAKAIQGTVSGGYGGGLRVLDDDPEPTVTITAVADRVAEGGVLTWSATSSAEADVPLFWYIWALPPDSGPELSSTDVDPEWFREHAGTEPQPAQPLSNTPLQLVMVIEPGSLTAELTIPTVTDDETEETEHVRLVLMDWPPIGASREVVGAVADQP